MAALLGAIAGVEKAGSSSSPDPVEESSAPKKQPCGGPAPQSDRNKTD